MKSALACLLTALFVFVLPGSLPAKTVYVNASSGSDANDGLTTNRTANVKVRIPQAGGGWSETDARSASVLMSACTLSDALDTDLAVDTSPTASWFGENSDSHDGTDAACSAPTATYSNSDMSVTVEGPARIGFWWKISGYYGSSVQFLIDESTYQTMYGNGGYETPSWNYYTTVIPSGTHTLTWRYYQDEYSAGSDCGWVDSLSVLPDWPIAHFDSASQTVSEDAGTVVIPVWLDRADTNTVTVSYLIGGTAVNGVDYTVDPASSVSFAPGETQTNLVVTVIDDTTPEPDETVVISLMPGTGVYAGNPSTQTLTIAYNDGMVVATGFQINGGADGTSSRDVSLDFTAANDPTEYAVGEDPTFSNAVWTAFTGTPISYTLSEGYGDKSVWLELRKPYGEGYLVSQPVSGTIVYGPPLDEAIDRTGEIVNTGGQNGGVWYSIMDPTAQGGSRAHSANVVPGHMWAYSWLTTTVTPALPSRLSFVYEKVGNGSLECYIDDQYTPLESYMPGQHTFETDLEPGPHTLRWSAYSDVEGGSGTPGYSLLDAVTLTALPPRVWFATNGQAVAESVGTVPVEVLLERPADTPVTVAYSFSGTASNGIDYILSPTGTVTFAPGETRTNFVVTVIDDTIPEHGEDAVFTLEGGEGCRAGDPAQYTLTILANDGIIDLLSVRLANGDSETTNRTVRVEAFCSEPPAEFMASEDPGFGGASWMAYGVGASYTLSATKGVKTVYVKTRIPLDGGGWSESGALSATVSLVDCTLKDALDTDALITTTTTPSAPWFGQRAVSHDGSDAAQSAPLAPYQYAYSEMSTTVQGPAKVSFWWRISSPASSFKCNTSAVS